MFSSMRQQGFHSWGHSWDIQVLAKGLFFGLMCFGPNFFGLDASANPSNPPAFPASEISFSKQILPLLVTPKGGNQFSCLGCHRPRGPNSYHMGTKSTEPSYELIVAKAVKAGLSKESLLCTKLMDPLPPGVPGERMPHKGPDYFSTEEIQLICDWIDQGAKNN